MSNMSSNRGGLGGLGTTSQTGSGMNKPAGSSISSGAAQVAAGTRQAGDEMKQQAANVAENAKDLASQAGDKILQTVEEQKVAGADFVSGMAGAMRRAANEFGDLPQAAQYIRLAAGQIEGVSNAFNRRDLNQLVSDVQDFARRQPTAFLGAAALAGFAVMRFLKTSTANTSASSRPRDAESYGPAAGPMMGGHSTAQSFGGSQPSGGQTSPLASSSQPPGNTRMP